MNYYPTIDEPDFIITDTHFNHPMLIEKGWRPADYQEQFLKNWNDTVNHESTVLHLGDVIMRSQSTLGDIMSKLPGEVRLIRGNHDQHNAKWYMQRGFWVAYDGPVICCGRQIIFSHEPISVPAGWINIHGHTHGAVHHDTELPPDYGPQHVEIAHEKLGYRPIPFSEILNTLPR